MSLHERRKREFPTPLQFQDRNFIGWIVRSDPVELLSRLMWNLGSFAAAVANLELGPAKQKSPGEHQDLGGLRRG